MNLSQIYTSSYTVLVTPKIAPNGCENSHWPGYTGKNLHSFGLKSSHIFTRASPGREIYRHCCAADIIPKLFFPSGARSAENYDTRFIFCLNTTEVFQVFLQILVIDEIRFKK